MVPMLTLLKLMGIQPLSDTLAALSVSEQCHRALTQEATGVISWLLLYRQTVIKALQAADREGSFSTSKTFILWHSNEIAAKL